MDGLLQAARRATGRPDARVVDTRERPAAHRVENMTTEALRIVDADLADGTTVSLFAKVLHHVSRSPGWHFVPEPFRPQVERELDWLDEPRVFRSGLAERMPAGVRLPALYHVEEDPAEQTITLWMELVDDDPIWNRDRYTRSAAALAALAGHWPEAALSADLGLARRPIDGLFFGKIVNHDLPILATEAHWERPEVAAVAAADPALRGDIAALADRVPDMLARLHGLEHPLAHGDATPDNIREPGDGTVVLIDWSYAGGAPLGSDLSQLVAGRVERGAPGTPPPAEIAPVVVDAFLAALDAAGVQHHPGDVRFAFATHLAVRSVFSAVNVDHRPDLCDGDLAELVARRAELARFGIDLANSVA